MLRKAADFRASLRDDRRVYFRGRRVPDVTTDPELGISVDLTASDFDFALDPEHRDLAVAHDPETDEEYSAYFRIPHSCDDLLSRSRLIELGTAHAGTLPPLIKEIGTDAIFALMRVLEGEALERLLAFYEHCRGSDLAMAVAQTDVKGDRSLAPSAQPDPDSYVHVVDRGADGIVVRGAKAHTTASANANELIVLPTRAMGPDDADYAVAFAVPIATPGLTLYVSPYSSAARGEFEHPLSSRTRLLESLTVFDDVRVPWERVFLCGEARQAGPVALTFVEYHRFTAVSYKLPLLDAMVGAAASIAEMNGVARAGHIRDKLAELVMYAETIRALTEMAALRGRSGTRDVWYPDPLTVNIAKHSFATRYHRAIALLQECAGGLLVTGPGDEDWESSEVRPVLEKYLAGAVPAEERLRMMHLISDITARDFGGYHAVLALHAEGSVEAEKLQVLRAYDPARALARARRFARLD